MYRFKSIKYLVTCAILSALLLTVGYVSSLIKISPNTTLQFSDGLYFVIITIIPGPMMIFCGIIYSVLLDLISGLFIYIPFSVVIHIIMFLIVYFLNKKIIIYLGFVLASFCTFIYCIAALIVYNQSAAIAELVVDSIQISITIISSFIIYTSLYQINSNLTLKVWNDRDFDRYKKQNRI